MLKFWSYIYRLTGWYSPWAELAEYQHIQKWVRKQKKFKKLEFYMGMEVGMWQVKHKFYRPFNWRKYK